MTRYVPIVPPQLDPRNEFVLASEAKERVVQASNNQLNDISPGSPISALMEGHAYAQAELLYYLNQAPEAWTATFLAQVLGIQILASQPASVVLEFTREPAVVNSSFIVSSGFGVRTQSGIVFELQNALEFAPGEQVKYGIAVSTTQGTSANVAANTVNEPTQTLTGISVTNPTQAYGGIDGESYNEAKSRAFSQIRRRNPVSIDDFQDLTEDILGVNTRIRVSPKSSAPLTQLAAGIFVEPGSDADTLYRALLDAKRITGQEQVLTEAETQIVADQLNGKNPGIEHIYISVKDQNNGSIDPVLLERTQQLIQNRTPAGFIVHVENALVQLVDIQIILQDDDLSQSTRIESNLRSFFTRLEFGDPLDYSVISSVISTDLNINDVFITTGAIIADDGIPSESVVDNVIVQLSKTGNTIFARSQAALNAENDTFFVQGDTLPAYGGTVLWKLNNITFVPSTQALEVLRYGTLLECRSDQSSVRADGAGGTYITANDLACISTQPDLDF